MNRIFILIAAILFCLPGQNFAATSFSIAGEWRFALDRRDAGIKEQWFNRELADKINLPGALQSQGYGDEISTNTPWVLSLYDKNWFLRSDYTNYSKPGAVKVPFLCQPPRHYLGAAWYQRDIEIPVDWKERRTVLFLERPHCESRVWLDDKLMGTNDSLCTPHEFELGVVSGSAAAPAAVRRAPAPNFSRADEQTNSLGTTQMPTTRASSAAPGAGALPIQIAPGKHRLTVRVDNRVVNRGPDQHAVDAHSVSDSLGQSWNGIVGKMELRSTTLVWIEDLQVYPHVSTKSLTVKGAIGNLTGKSGNGKFDMIVTPFQFPSPPDKPRITGSTNFQVNWATNGRTFECELSLNADVRLWDEFNPTIYRLMVWFGDNTTAGRHFGLREFKANGTDFEINGRKTFLRGTHHGGDFPLTGYPPTDVEYWRKIFQINKDWGMNHIRFHSYCPPEAAFEAADELGLYLQIEPGTWNTFSPGSAMDESLYAETERILKAYGNHPSFMLFSPSNEPKGRWKESLTKWAEHFRAEDPRRLYTSGTGFTDPDAPGPLDKVDYTATQRFGGNRVRGEGGWFGRDYSRSLQGVNVPVVTHEVGQWIAYPDYDIIKKFTGYMRPGNYEIFRDSAEAHGVFGRAGSPLPTDGAHGVTRPTNHDFAWASGRFQLACYKEEIEANLRTPGLSGFQLLDLHDYVGQGTALVGLLDTFWEAKGYVKADEFKQFCNTVVPLARFTKRVFTTADRFDVPLEIANFGSTAITNPVVLWNIFDESGGGKSSGLQISQRVVPLGLRRLTTISNDFKSSGLDAPGRYTLSVRLRDTAISNSWNFWLYPTKVSDAVAQGVSVTSSWDDAEAKLAAGGKVLFLPRNADLDWTSPPLDVVPVFWNRLMSPAWGRMLGLWCDTNHPALAGFPTEANCDWQWTQITRGTRPVNLDKLPHGLQPIVSAIDDWNRNWKLGAIFECKVGAGRLLVSSFDLTTDLDNRPVARQLRRSLLDYMAGEKFQPKVEVSAAEFRSVLFDTRIMRKLGAKAIGDGVDAAAAIDGDPNTSWLVGEAGRNRRAAPHPHELTITFPAPVDMGGVVIMPRQNDRDHLGDIRGYKLETSNDGTNWFSRAQGELASTWEPQRLTFAAGPVFAKRIRLTALSGFGNDSSAAVAELAVIYLGPKLTATETGNLEYRRSRSTSTDVDEAMDAPVRRTNAIPRNP